MKTKIFIALGIMLCFAGTALAAAGVEPGSSNDPLVSKSYVDNLFQKVTSSGVSNEFQVIELQAGKKILGHANCEIILRSGSATTMSYKQDGIENGLQDITDGVDLLGGVDVPMNHLILIPRTDTRGIVARTPIYVMIRGEYEIKN